MLTVLRRDTPVGRVSLHTSALQAEERSVVISRVTDDVWTEAVSEDTGPEKRDSGRRGD